MNERQKRLIEVYEYLRRYFGIHTKTGFAEAIQYGRTSMSAAMNGDEKYLTDSLFKNICAVFPGVFNLDYLLTGNGSLLAEEVVHDDDTLRITETIDPSSLVNAALAAKDETIAAIRQQLEAKDQLIVSLRQQIELLKSGKRDHHQYPLMASDNPKV
jgi:hypothetical protein